MPVEVSVTATVPGTNGNISQYALNSTSTPGISHVTNVLPFINGTDVETDAAFKRRILGVFYGANTGTTAGYKNAVLADPNVSDAVVVGPGDPLMTRDGTIVNIAADGTRTIVSEGSGGKVDIYVYGFILSQIIDSFIYLDKSNKNDPTNIANNYVFGQIASEVGQSVLRRRVQDLANGILPTQPVNNILSVVGSVSGSNYQPKSVNAYGVVFGNYELVKDTGDYAGTPWAFDQLQWIDNNIRGYSENITKTSFNSTDPVSFPGVTAIDGVIQGIQITNENSTVNPANRASIQLAHYPVSVVSRVLNKTTGERYVVSNSNPNGGSSNTTGVITISGNTLPAISDILQVDYIWNLSYDPAYDFDNLTTSNNIRTITNSIDWAYSNIIRKELSSIVLNGSQKTVTISNPVGAVVTVNTFIQETQTVILNNDRKAVNVSAGVLNVISIMESSGTQTELYNTAKADGSISGYTIFLPSDSIANVNDSVIVQYNATDTFTVNGLSGFFNGNVITVIGGTPGQTVECNYIAGINQLVPATQIGNLPILGSLNTFNTGGYQPIYNVYDGYGNVLSNLRLSPTRLKLVVSGNINPGTFTISGTTLRRVSGIFSVNYNGLVQDLSGLILQQLNISSIPSGMFVSKIVSVAKVETASDGTYLSTDFNYDVGGYHLSNNRYSKLESVLDSTLTNTQLQLPNTTFNSNNIPGIGNKALITFYVALDNDYENVSFTASGSQYSNKIYAYVNTISASSGFVNSTNSTLSVFPQNQPVQGSIYSGAYDYLAPQPNERISVYYNQNSVIANNTLDIESLRPIGSDVLVKAAVAILLDVSINITIDPNFINSSTVITQNVQDAVTSFINANKLDSTVYSSACGNTAFGVNGVVSARVTYFNVDGQTGSLYKISAQENQYIQANNVVISIGL